MVTLHRYLARLIFACIAPLLLVALSLAGSYALNLQAALGRAAADQAHNAAVLVDRLIEAQIATLQMLAASPLLDDPPRLDKFYQEALGFRDHLGGHVVLADPSLQMLLNTRVPFGAPLPKLPRPEGHAAAPAVLKTGRPAVGDMFRGPIAGEPLVAIAVPVVRGEKIRYVLLSTLETRRFGTHLDEMAIPPERSLTLLDGRGEPMARRAAPSADDRFGSTRGGRRFVAESAFSPWSVVLEVPRSAYYAPAITAALALTAAIVAAALLSLLLGRRAGGGLVRSVAALAEIPSSQPAHCLIAEIEAVRQRLNEAHEARRAAEAALRQSEERYRRIVETTTEGVFTVDADYRIDFVNRRMLDMLGYREEEMLGRTPMSFLDGESRALAETSALRRREGMAEQLELRFLRRDRSSLWALVNSTPIFDAEGRFAGAVAMAADISARKQAEQERDRLFTYSLDLLCVEGFDGYLKQVNPAWTATLGWTSEELKAKPCLEFVHPDDRDATLRAAEQSKQGQHVRGLENRYRCRDGSYRWLSWNSFPLPSEGLMLCVVRDVTERKKSEEDLRASEMRIRNIFEQASDGIYLISSEFRYLDANPRGLELLGYTREELLQMTVADGLAPHERPRLAVELAEMLAGRPHLAEWEHLRKDGSTFPAEVSARRLDDRSYIAIVRDLTGRRRLEEHLRATVRHLRELSRRLVETEEAERQAISRELHDRIGSNLSAIRLALEIIGARVPPGLQPEIGPRLADTRKLLEDTIHEVRNIMEELRPPALDELGLLAALGQHARETSARSGIAIEVQGIEPSPRLAPEVEIALFRIAQEALTNVVKHARATRAVVSIRSDGPCLQLAVEDDGCGFDAAAPRPEVVGGLGMVTMRERAEAIGAAFRTESASGGGVRVIVELPMAAS